MTAGRVIDTYVEEVTAALPGPPRVRGDMMAELRSGLLDVLPVAAAAAASVARLVLAWRAALRCRAVLA